MCGDGTQRMTIARMDIEVQLWVSLSLLDRANIALCG